MEILKFMIVAWQYEGKPENFTNWHRYFDSQIKQKILPKIHGSKREIGETLTKLAEITKEDYYPKSYKKIQEMNEKLETQQFTSFIR